MVSLGESLYPLSNLRSSHRQYAHRAELVSFAVGSVAVFSLGIAHGGYFPTAWGWATVAFAVVGLWSFALRPLVRLPLIERTFVAALVAFACWFAASSFWGRPPEALQQTFRVLVYCAAALTALVFIRSSTARALLAGVLLGSACVAAYALATRLFPDRFGGVDPVASYRLSTPIGYWNALGLLCAIALLLALTLAAHTDLLLSAAFAVAPAPVLVVALYFTFSRGSWIALGIGFVVALALDPRRVRLTAIATAAGVPAALGLLAASRSAPLTHLRSTVALAAHDGHRLTLLLLAFVVASAALTAAVLLLGRLLTLPSAVSRFYPVALAVAALIAVSVALVELGGSSSAARRTWDSFAAPPPKQQVDLGKRLFSFSGNGRADLFRVAWHDATAHPVVGSGAGSYEAYWLAHRKVQMKVRNAHSLYLETLAETGTVGLAILLVALFAPLIAAVRARRRPGVAAAIGAYVAYLAGAAVDWDWQITSVTLAAIFVGVALLASARLDEEREASLALRYGVLGVLLAIGVVGFVFLVGNMFLSRASSAAADAKWATAARDAHRASTWLPWSTQPLTQLGEAQLVRGQVAAAQASFDKAIAKDAGDWNLWFDLARATTGATRRAALAHATKLDPLGPEIAAFRSDLDAQSGISITAGGAKR